VNQVDPAAVAQIEIDEGDIGPDAGSQQLPGFRQRSSLPNNLEIRLAVEQKRQRLTRAGMIVDQQQADWTAAYAMRSRSNQKRVSRPGSDATLNSEPDARTILRER
jgi:hypothetical protein